MEERHGNSELIIFKNENNNLIKIFLEGVDDPFKYCSSALKKIAEMSEPEQVFEKLTEDEIFLISTEKKYNRIKYSYFFLIAAHFFRWDLNLIAKFDLLQQDMMMQGLLENLELSEKILDVAHILSPKVATVYAIYHRWVLQVYSQNSENLRSFKEDEKYKKSKNCNFFEKIQSRADESYKILFYLLKKYDHFELPIPNILNALMQLRECLLDEIDIDSNDFAQITENFKFPTAEMLSLISFDLGIFRFNCQEYLECLRFLDGSIMLQEEVESSINVFDKSVFDEYKKICNEMISESRPNKFDNKNYEKIIDEVKKNYILPFYFFSDAEYISESAIKRFCKKYKKNNITDEENSIVSIFLKYLYYFVPERTKLLDDFFSRNSKSTSIEDSDQKINLFSIKDSLNEFPTKESFYILEPKLRVFQIELELFEASTYLQIDNCVKRLHNLQKQILFSKKNQMHVNSLEILTSGIDDPYLYDLIHILFTKVKFFKSQKNYNTCLDMLNNFYDYLNKNDNLHKNTPYFIQLCGITIDGLLINSILKSNHDPEWVGSALVQCRQFAESYPTGSLFQHVTLVYVLSELCNTFDTRFISSLTNTHLEPHSLQRLIFLSVKIYDILHTNSEQTEDFNEIWYLVLDIVSDNQSLYQLNTSIFLKFMKKIRNVIFRDLISSIFISIYNRFNDIKLQAYYAIPCRISEEQYPNMETITMILQAIFERSTKIDCHNLYWQRTYSDILFCKKLYKLALKNYLKLCASVTHEVQETMFWSKQIIINMVFCCEMLKAFSHGFLLCCVLKLYDDDILRTLGDLAINDDQDIFCYIHRIYNTDVLEYLSEKAISENNSEIINKINLRIRSLGKREVYSEIKYFDQASLNFLMEQY